MTRHTLMLALGLAICIPAVGRAQASDQEIEVIRLLSVPLTALPPLSLPMPASRNHSYWIGRLQAGYRKTPSGYAVPAGALGLDRQIKGGSVFGVTGGYQKRDCKIPGSECGGHTLFGARAQINIVTGGTMFANLLRDNTATSTLGAEFGFGYAPKVVGDMNACALNFGLPFSVAKRRQRPRLVGYVTPGVVWDFSCGSKGPDTHKSYYTDFGVALQQVGNRSFDIYFGMQKVYRARTGLQTGVSFSYVRLP